MVAVAIPTSLTQLEVWSRCISRRDTNVLSTTIFETTPNWTIQPREERATRLQESRSWTSSQSLRTIGTKGLRGRCAWLATIRIWWIIDSRGPRPSRRQLQTGTIKLISSIGIPLWRIKRDTRASSETPLLRGRESRTTHSMMTRPLGEPSMTGLWSTWTVSSLQITGNTMKPRSLKSTRLLTWASSEGKQQAEKIYKLIKKARTDII